MAIFWAIFSQTHPLKDTATFLFTPLSAGASGYVVLLEQIYSLRRQRPVLKCVPKFKIWDNVGESLANEVFLK
jgi:hypothetical protein